MGTRGSFLGGKAAGAWSWPLTSIYLMPKSKNVWCSQKKSTVQLYLTLPCVCVFSATSLLIPWLCVKNCWSDHFIVMNFIIFTIHRTL
jgi:hypothetical protein